MFSNINSLANIQEEIEKSRKSVDKIILPINLVDGFWDYTPHGYKIIDYLYRIEK